MKHISVLLCVLLVTFVNSTQSQTLYVWSGGTGNWGVATNWTPNGVPTTTDTVSLAVTSPVSICTIDMNASCAKLIMTGSGSTASSGPILQFPASGAITLTVNDTLRITGGSGGGSGDRGARPQLTSNGNASAMLVLNGYAATTSSNSSANGNAGLNMHEGTVIIGGSSSSTLSASAGFRLGNLQVGDGTNVKTFNFVTASSAQTMAVASVLVKTNCTFNIGNTTNNLNASIGNTTVGVTNLSGGITIEAGATFAVQTASAAIASASNLNLMGGGITNNGTMILNSGGSFPRRMDVNVSAGTNIISGANAITFSGLTMNSALGVSLSQDAAVNATLTLTTGTVSTGNNTLTVGASGTVARTGGHVIGALRKLSFTGGKLFEVGTVNGYTPVQMTATGTGDFTVRTNQGKHPNRVNENVLGMYWTLTNGGITSADIIFKYLNADVNGTETSYDAARWDGASWTLQSATVSADGDSAIVLGVTSFSDWTLGEPSSLPVQLASFTATVLSSNTVRLNWMTISEVNNYGFYVERRPAGSTAWNELVNSFVPGHGTTNTPHHYSYTDNVVARGSLQYRLKQVDLDGTTHFSEPIHVQSLTSVGKTAPHEFILKQNYPNPFNPATEIQFSVEKTERVTLTVYNTLGEKVETLFDDVAEPGKFYNVKFDGSAYASGIYFYRLETENATQMKKLILMK